MNAAADHSRGRCSPCCRHWRHSLSPQPALPATLTRSCTVEHLACFEAAVGAAADTPTLVARPPSLPSRGSAAVQLSKRKVKPVPRTPTRTPNHIPQPALARRWPGSVAHARSCSRARCSLGMRGRGAGARASPHKPRTRRCGAQARWCPPPLRRWRGPSSEASGVGEGWVGVSRCKGLDEVGVRGGALLLETLEVAIR